jgi:hypothetical protein
MKNAVAYMAWERIVPWKILSLKEHPYVQPVPVGYGARNKDFKNLEPGSQIWVVTRIADEFSLAGRVFVDNIFDRDLVLSEKRPKEIAGLFVKWRYVAEANRNNSEFFEANNAEPVLTKYNVKFARNRTIVYFDGSLEDSFRSCIEQARKTVFISYRWAEARRFAIALAREFRKRGFSPWLDALSIPDYEAKGEPGVNRQRLEKLIELGIGSSKMAVVINTMTYAEKEWTKNEFALIKENHIPWFQVMRGGGQLKCRTAPIFIRKPDAIVQEILKNEIPGSDNAIF